MIAQCLVMYFTIQKDKFNLMFSQLYKKLKGTLVWKLQSPLQMGRMGGGDWSPFRGPHCEQNDKHARLKILPSRNFDNQETRKVRLVTLVLPGMHQAQIS